MDVPVSDRPEVRSLATQVEAWLKAHTYGLVWLLVAGGLYLRFLRAGESYLNGDETQIMFPPLQRGLGDVYAASLKFPYGPFLHFFLHAWSHFGTSELYLRMPFVIAGVLTTLVAYHWVADAYGRAAGLVAAAILCFAPPLIHISTEVRPYAIHMLWVACSMYFLERAFRKNDAIAMHLFGMSAIIALLTLYMSALFLAAIGVYALVRIARRELSRKLVFEWAVIQIIAVTIGVTAFVTSLSPMQNTRAEVAARDVWLRSSYYHPDSQAWTGYLASSTTALFDYLFANPQIGLGALVIFLGSLVLLLWRNRASDRVAALSLVLPLLATCAAGTLRLYPYGGSRHDAFLGLFVAAAVGVGLSSLLGERLTLLIPAGALLLPVWLSVEQPHTLDDLPQFQRWNQMHDALDYLSNQAAGMRTVVTDAHGSAMLTYYVCHGATESRREVAPLLGAYRCMDREILVVHEWSVAEDALADALHEARVLSPGSFRDPACLFYVVPNPGKFGNPNPPVGVGNPGKIDGWFGKFHIRQI